MANLRLDIGSAAHRHGWAAGGLGRKLISHALKHMLLQNSYISIMVYLLMSPLLPPRHAFPAGRQAQHEGGRGAGQQQIGMRHEYGQDRQ